MTLGYKQRALIDLGKKKGFVDGEDLAKIYKTDEGKRAMNCLILTDDFHQEKLSNNGLKIIWKIKR